MAKALFQGLRRLALWGMGVIGLMVLVGVLHPSVALGAAEEIAVPVAPAALFELHCAGCHPNGSNIIRRGKSLQPKALKRHGVDSVGAIATLITQGKGLMSAYGDRLTPEQIQTLADYVWQQSQSHWQG